MPPINLLRGWPHPSLLPTPHIRAASAAVLFSPSSAPTLLYGPDEGHPALLSALSRWLTTSYAPPAPVAVNRLAVTGGASQSLGCILQAVTDPVYTRGVWCIVPAYMLAFPIFADAGFAGKMRGVPEDDEGVDIGFLRKAMQECERSGDIKEETPETRLKPGAAKIYRHVVYAVPAFANPSAKTMSGRRREELIRLAREFDALVVADDVYDHLRWPPVPGGRVPAPRARVVDVDRDLEGGAEREGADGFGNALSNGSFSKICAPGVRTGWVEGTPKLAYAISQTGTTRSGGAASQLAAAFMAHMLDTGVLQDHITNVLQPAYAARQRILLDAVETYLVPLGGRVDGLDEEVRGGYFVWVHLPKGVSAVALAARVKEEVIVAPGAMFEVPGDGVVRFPEDLRLCFAWEEVDGLAEGQRRRHHLSEEAP
ncbi:PLP-dependent transferase [Trichodelitschia bisporula]|uniref:PLP-dependent transferase n=1 Tax=Trichodelitschia bisporula TaxID=703511 RepID=A0A6G1HKB9_9PEZI|nr:PLP-dependent transferase [Trichodelitschia bisporula]